MKIGNKITNPGELNQYLAYYKRTVNTGTGGFQEKNLVLIDQAWTRVIGAHGLEAWVAGTTRAIRPMTLLRRYKADIDETTVVKIGNEYFEVRSIDNIQLRNEYLELKVELVKPG